MKKVYFLFPLIVLSLFLSGCGEQPYSNNALYECKNGDYTFPETEPVFDKLSIGFIEWDELKADECLLTLEYKIEFDDPEDDNPYVKRDYDSCTITLPQLATLKEKNAGLATVLKAANCDYKTNYFLKETN